MAALASRAMHRRCPWALLAPLVPLLPFALLPGAASATGGEQVVITGSAAERRIVEAPYAIGTVDAETLRAAGPMLQLSEALARVPGLQVATRNNFAQDLQVASRGFGARATFGVRGLRLYTDGIPATMPDGQGQIAHADLAGAARVEVLRGPFSVLYGNSSGGVVSVIAAPVRERTVDGALDLGSFGLRQARVGLALPLAGGDDAPGNDLRLGAAAMRIDGFRPHSAAERRLVHLRLGLQPGGGRDRFVLVASHHEQPAQDPLGLRREDFDADPRRTAPEAQQYDTRKLARQSQAGASWRHRFDDGALREVQAAAWAGRRSVVQWLAIPATTQANPRHGGGTIDFDRLYGGAELRAVWRWERVELQAGAQHERQDDDRRGYLNHTGPVDQPVYGRTGEPRRDERNRARGSDVFAQVEWAAAPAWWISGGLRAGRVELSADDRYLSNGDDSGARRFDHANPVLGLRWQASPALTLHASAARGFETPTLGELAYRPDGSGGFNTDLRPQLSRQAEAGAKWRSGPWQADLALFTTATRDEIAVASNSGGRASFRNIGRTARRGAELALGWEPAAAWRMTLAATLLHAELRDAFLACAGVPCAAPSLPVPAGRRIAGTQRASGFAEVAWRPGGLGEFALELRGQSRTAVDDTNSDFAPGFAVWNLRWLGRAEIGGGLAAELLARVDNVADRRHAGSVIVGEGNRRFFEPGAPRSMLLSLRLAQAF
ncbi:MAG: TonB-dependent receptor [Rubrivivax sp.]|nr:TonB-dependent receptor [Rubrivivax sp.]